MPTDTAQNYRSSARHFALRGAAWSIALFGLVRLSWFETRAVLPLTEFQARVAAIGFGRPALPIDVTLACSGADAVALCTGAILAYPTGWRMRLGGATGGIGLILALNTLRLGTLGRAAGSPSWFAALHVYIWPALLTLAMAGYVFGWMRLADKPRAVALPLLRSKFLRSTPVAPHVVATRRFVLLTAAFLVLFTAASPLYLESTRVLALAGFIARSAAFALRLLGMPASSSATVLSTPRGAFLVTQECISTPVIPVYLAAVFAYSETWRSRALGVLAGPFIFIGLGIARLLVVALPSALVSSPLFFIHAFYQLLLAGVLVCLAAFWRHGAGATAWHRALVGGLLGGVLVYLLGPLYARVLASVFAAGAPLSDPQGAIALLPAFQIGLYVALSVAVFVALDVRPFVTGLALLGASQIVVFAALGLLVRHAGFMPHVRDVRAWAVAGPILAVVALVTYERPHR